MMFLSNPELYLFQLGGIDYTGPLLTNALEKDTRLKVIILSCTIVASSGIMNLEQIPDKQFPVFTRGFDHFMAWRGKPNLDFAIILRLKRY